MVKHLYMNSQNVKNVVIFLCIFPLVLLFSCGKNLNKDAVTEEHYLGLFDANYVGTVNGTYFEYFDSTYYGYIKVTQNSTTGITEFNFLRMTHPCFPDTNTFATSSMANPISFTLSSTKSITFNKTNGDSLQMSYLNYTHTTSNTVSRKTLHFYGKK